MEHAGPWSAYKLVWKRRRMLWRSFRSRHRLTSRVDRTGQIDPGGVLCFATMRNEMQRLPYFLKYYRSLGVSHFLVVDNDSTDDTPAYLSQQPDVSVWQTSAVYRDARFGLDWIGWLLMRYGHGHWCLSVDADELLTYAHADTRPLPELTDWLDRTGRAGFGALMLDLYPRDGIGGDLPEDPLQSLRWFDAGPYRSVRQAPMENLWTQGGARERVFFGDNPRQSPTLNKIPLIRWNRRFAYVNSTHSALPRRLNHLYDGPGGSHPSGVLLHTKFLPDAVARAREDTTRRQHFHDPDQFSGYYDALMQAPSLWHPNAVEYEGWAQLERLGLMTSGGFGDA